LTYAANFHIQFGLFLIFFKNIYHTIRVRLSNNIQKKSTISATAASTNKNNLLMEQIPSGAANWFSGSQEITRILWNPKAIYRIHKYLS
jgi:hypothetical protein